ncbi:hypothetical protein [Staphylococcus aureus]|uniref:hypothetical protein n=1 Tax=Staphylococcus aureus TaxID=1280 RepID=UPI00164360F3|nr:hypothetical protein [Staphylococcus aureus]
MGISGGVYGGGVGGRRIDRGGMIGVWVKVLMGMMGFMGILLGIGNDDKGVKDGK